MAFICSLRLPTRSCKLNPYIHRAPLTKIDVESKIPVKSTPGLALVEVHPLRAVGLAALQPDVRRDLKNIVNDSLHHPKQNLFAMKSTSGLVLVEVLHLGVASLAGLQPDVRSIHLSPPVDFLTLPVESNI